MSQIAAEQQPHVFPECCAVALYVPLLQPATVGLQEYCGIAPLAWGLYCPALQPLALSLPMRRIGSNHTPKPCRSRGSYRWSRCCFLLAEPGAYTSHIRTAHRFIGFAGAKHWSNCRLCNSRSKLGAGRTRVRRSGRPSARQVARRSVRQTGVAACDANSGELPRGIANPPLSHAWATASARSYTDAKRKLARSFVMRNPE